MIYKQICKLFQKYKLEICKNPEKYKNFNTVDKYINNKNLLKHLGVIEIEEIIHTIQGTIISNEEFNKLISTIQHTNSSKRIYVNQIKQQ
jgi:hypothetical protein